MTTKELEFFELQLLVCAPIAEPIYVRGASRKKEQHNNMYPFRAAIGG